MADPTPPKQALRMFLLQYGEECVPKSMSVRGAGPEVNWEPVVGILVETTIGWVILDTGFSRQALDDKQATFDVYGPAAFGADRYIPPRGIGAEPFLHALEGVGVRLDQIVLGAISHFHIDHSGGLRFLGQAGIPVAVQRRELEFATTKATIHHAYYRPDYEGHGLNFRVIEGDTELAPGVWALSSPGHTPGHMSYRVDLPETGTWIFTMDAADLGQNLFERIGIGTTALPEDEALVEPSLFRLIDLANETGARLVPCHDPWFWKAVKHPQGGHR